MAQDSVYNQRPRHSDYQAAYINNLQHQILAQQAQIELARTQWDGNRRSMQGFVEGLGGSLGAAVSGLVAGENEESVRGNPLAASALARRRKRQSMVDALAVNPVNLDPLPSQPHQRRSSSSSSASNLSSSTPPSLILSKPGDTFPLETGTAHRNRKATTPSPHLRASSSPDQSLPLRASNLHERFGHLAMDTDLNDLHLGLKSAPLQQAPPRRTSQAATLSAALGRKRRSSIGSSTTPSLSVPPTPRSVSDSSVLSPFASTFNPLPPASPYLSSPNDYGTQYYDYLPSPSPRIQVQAVAGTATPTRQPKGPAPEAEFGSANFAIRLRKRAITALLGGRLRST